MTLHTLYWFLLLVFICPNNTLGQYKHGIQLKECYLKDKTKFDACLMKYWQEIPKTFPKGIPELKVPVLDPLFIDILEFNDQGVALQATAKFINITVLGASKVFPKMVKVDRKNRVLTINVTIPYLNCSGQYEMKGSLMLLPIDSRGRVTLNMTNVDAVIKSNPILKGSGITIDKVAIDFNVKEVYIRLDGLLGEDTVGEAINNLISDNSKQIFKDLQPLIGKKLENSIHNLTANAYNAVPHEAFIS